MKKVATSKAEFYILWNMKLNHIEMSGRASTKQNEIYNLLHNGEDGIVQQFKSPNDVEEFLHCIQFIHDSGMNIQHVLLKIPTTVNSNKYSKLVI